MANQCSVHYRALQLFGPGAALGTGFQCCAADTALGEEDPRWKVRLGLGLSPVVVADEALGLLAGLGGLTEATARVCASRDCGFAVVLPHFRATLSDPHGDGSNHTERYETTRHYPVASVSTDNASLQRWFRRERRQFRRPSWPRVYPLASFDPRSCLLPSDAPTPR